MKHTGLADIIAATGWIKAKMCKRQQPLGFPRMKPCWKNYKGYTSPSHSIFKHGILIMLCSLVSLLVLLNRSAGFYWSAQNGLFPIYSSKYLSNRPGRFYCTPQCTMRSTSLAPPSPYVQTSLCNEWFDPNAFTKNVGINTSIVKKYSVENLASCPTASTEPELSQLIYRGVILQRITTHNRWFASEIRCFIT